ncbi:hypothetical protein QV65_21545 [Rhodococcus erythropolis]|nr:hypothetical protein QV65_21545 [Rhodococcus erythropolis]
MTVGTDLYRREVVRDRKITDFRETAHKLCAAQLLVTRSANLIYIGALIGYRNRNEANTCREQQFYIPIRTEPVAG